MYSIDRFHSISPSQRATGNETMEARIFRIFIKMFRRFLASS